MESMHGTPVTAFVLRERLIDLVEGTTTLAQFDEWFAVHTWDDSNVAFDARWLAGRVELVLAEFTSGHRTWQEVREELERLAHRIEVTMGGAPIRTTGSTTGTTIQASLPELPVIREVAPERPSAEANTQYATVSV